MRRNPPTEGLPWTALHSMREYYTDRAPYHDEYMSWKGQQDLEVLLAPIVDVVAEVVRDRRVLEVACGTGNWTQVVSSRARTVMATDLVAEYLELARQKEYPRDNVTFQEADAYDLRGTGGPFEAAVAVDLWSHVPRSMEDTLLASLASVLEPSSPVLLVDMLRSEVFDLSFHRFDADGNEVHLRTLPNGRTYHVVKNFTDEDELRGRLEPWAEDVDYEELPDLGRWMLTFTTRP
jgi:2-polyprenyl-3-methyl-5-hydroxy-6-metoxy-1,4-benzoquinol methylase